MKEKTFKLYTKQLYNDRTDTEYKHPWVYRGVVKKSSTHYTAANLYDIVEKTDKTGG